MDPLLILLLAMGVVIGSVLRLRLHPFLALLAGALVVAALTSSEDLFERELAGRAWHVIESAENGQLRLEKKRNEPFPSGRFVWQREAQSAGRSTWSTRGQLELRTLDDAHAVADSNGQPLPEPGDRLVSVAALNSATELRDASWTERIADGFGSTCGKIGILIALAAVIGRCLLDSGSAERIVDAIRGTLGPRQTPLALALSGFVIGIPVYFDTVFYLLLPLARALARQTHRDYLLYILSIIVGATMAHSLVPPTPGPLLVAAELNVNLGVMIVAGILVGGVALASGYLYALWANRRWTIPLRDEAPAAVATGPAPEHSGPRPPLGLALLPIALPVLLLSLGTVLDSGWLPAATTPIGTATRAVLATFGDKHLALGLAAVIALLARVRYADSATDLPRAISEALLSAGSIVLITAAGGAFGHVLGQSGIAESIQARSPLAAGGISLLLIAFFVTSIIRVAQGSATVAMITAVGVVAPLAQATTLTYHPVYLALAIGCGSKPVPWMNDSGFWIITRMSGMTESESLRTFSVALTLMGAVGLLTTIAGAVWFPGI